MTNSSARFSFLGLITTAVPYAEKSVAGARAPLVQALGDENKEVRYGASLALGWLGNEKAVKPLLKTLNDKDLLVRQTAKNALVSINRRVHVRRAYTKIKS